MAVTHHDPLWRIFSHGRERRLHGRPYWFDNHRRDPLGNVVFQYTIAGSMTFRDRQGAHEIGPGCAVLFAFGEPSSYGLTRAHQASYECRWFNFGGAGLSEHWRALREKFGSILHLGDDAALEVEMIELAELGDPRRSLHPATMAVAVHGFIMRLYERAERRYSAQQPSVLLAVEHIVRQPTLAWSLKQIASRYGCSREHLCRVFHERLGLPPGQFVTRARIHHALRLLEQTQLPIHEVARQSGFPTVNALRRRIVESHGMTPTVLRQRLIGARRPR